MKDRMRAIPMVLEALVLTIIMVLAAPTLLRAEYYRYIDKTGAVRYTDNLLAVPEAQRPIVKKYIGRNEISEDAIPVIASPEDGVEKDGVEKKTEQINPDDSKQLEFEYLSQKKAALDKEYDAIIKEKNAMTQDKEKVDIKDYNEEVRQFNERITAYEERRKAFQKEADAFNAPLNQ